MKIDFNASYKSLAQIIFAKEATPVKPAKVENFDQNLEAAARLNPKAIDLITKSTNTEQPVPPPLPNNPVYELPFKDEIPEIVQPVPGLKQIPLESIETEDIADTGVKTPTVISVRRTSAPTDYLPNRSAEYSAATYKPLIENIGVRHGLDPVLGMAIAQAESSFNPNAVSADGHYSKGLFQLLDKTGMDMMTRLEKSEQYDPYNPELNADLGLGYLRYLHDIFSTKTELPDNRVTVAAANSTSLEKLAVAAYNAGEGRVASAQKRALAAGNDPTEYDQIANYLPDITQQYVQKVTSFKSAFASDLDSPSAE